MNAVDDLTEETQAALVAAARDASPVRGLTHGYYKYPARFSPVFASAAIKAFTKPGDLVLDPHVGGGTTLVEALACGREAIGVDISSLAEFITNVKCTVYSEAELETLEEWSGKVAAPWTSIGRQRRSPTMKSSGTTSTSTIPRAGGSRKAIEQSIAAAIKLGTPRLEAFGRCVVLRTAQWALDGRSKRATIDDFRRTLEETADDMVNGARNLRRSVRSTAGSSR